MIIKRIAALTLMAIYSIGFAEVQIYQAAPTPAIQKQSSPQNIRGNVLQQGAQQLNLQGIPSNQFRPPELRGVIPPRQIPNRLPPGSPQPPTTIQPIQTNY